MTNTTRDRASLMRCRILRLHRWVVRSTDDGSRYEVCARCDRERPDQYEPTGGIGIAGALGTGGGAAF